MLRVHDVMSVDVRTIVPEATLAEAVRLLAEERFTGLPVVATGGKILGVVSTSDILEFASTMDEGSPGRSPGPADEPWAAPAEWEEGEEPPAAYFASLWEDDGVDLIERAEDRTAGAAADALDDHSVGEIMTRTVVSIAPDAEVREAARQMLRAGIHRLLVVEDDRLVGLVSTTDVVKAVAQYGVAG